MNKIYPQDLTVLGVIFIKKGPKRGQKSEKNDVSIMEELKDPSILNLFNLNPKGSLCTILYAPLLLLFKKIISLSYTCCLISTVPKLNSYLRTTTERMLLLG